MFTTKTQFWFGHNKTGHDLQVQLADFYIAPAG
jgi:hypothetical protein